MALINFHDRFFQPLWRRIAVVALCGAWGLFELSTGAVFGGVLFIGIGAVSAYQFFVNWTDFEED